MEDENLCLLKLANVGPGILLMSNDSEQIVQAVTHVKTRWQLSQPVCTTLHDWFIKCAPKFLPIRYRTQINRDLVAHFFRAPGSSSSNWLPS